MVLHPDRIFGRLGNRLFQSAFCYAFARDNNVDFYFQDPVYFDKYREEIRAIFGSGASMDKVAVHVRRGDYVNNLFYVDLTQTDYYERAMSMFPGERFIIFSDDINWCREQEIFKDCEFSFGTEMEDLEKMSGCKGIIMANSSFSWWGAYLSNAKVIAPKEWYKDGAKRTKVLDMWITI